MKNLCNSHKISIFVRALAQHSTAQHLNSRNSVVTTPYDINPLDGSQFPSSGFFIFFKQTFSINS
ncbi:hypothetical protein [Capnocytophaga cynodegmi]|uniref:hypothetical protein n=1 Tax=Capnocytophaga cynodegmi TaxID=28189 RepID=UPI001EE2D47B|nr:hypothetical protein [Capnocytophaga cynodegmi]